MNLEIYDWAFKIIGYVCKNKNRINVKWNLVSFLEYLVRLKGVYVEV